MHSNTYFPGIGLVIVVVVIVSGLAPRAVAATDPEAFRTGFLNDLTLLESISPQDAARQFADVKTRIRALTPAELTILQGTLHSGWSSAVQRLRQLVTSTRALSSASTTRSTAAAPAAQPSTLVLDPVPPVTFSDVCSYPGISTEAGVSLLIAAGFLKTSAAAAQALCDVIVIAVVAGEGGGTNAPACVVAGLSNAAAEAAKGSFDGFDFCSGDIDSRFIEATYDLLVKTYKALDQTLSQRIEEALHACTPMASIRLPAQFGGNLETARNLVRALLDQVIAADEIRPGQRNAAEREYAAAVTDIGAGRYGRGYYALCRAYHHLNNWAPD